MAYQGNHPLTNEAKHNPHIQALLQQHASVEEELRHTLANPATSDDEIRKLKIKRLRLTEEIVRQRQ